MLRILSFTLDEPRYALPLAAVERVVRAVEVTPLPEAPGIVLGVINAAGEIVPVVDVRRRFRLPPRELELGDRLILARTSRRRVALAVDAVAGVRELTDADAASAGQAVPFAAYLQGVAKLDGGIVLIHDLDRFLSLDEERRLDAALPGDAG